VEDLGALYPVQGHKPQREPEDFDYGDQYEGCHSQTFGSHHGETLLIPLEKPNRNGQNEKDNHD
jgi:hypothetical protein